MQVKTIIESYPYLHKLSQRELPHGVAFSLVELIVQMEAVMKYFMGEKDKLAKKYAIEEDGALKIPKESVPAFNAELESIVSIEKELKYEPIRITKNMIHDKTFTAAELLGARPFVIYEAEGGE